MTISKHSVKEFKQSQDSKQRSDNSEALSINKRVAMMHERDARETVRE